MTSVSSSQTGMKRNPFVSKWNILFDTNMSQWISFEPELGKYVYPCYACRHMFSSKSSFLDHVNRRSLLLKYKCTSCPQLKILTFYNPCALLLHSRQHFSLANGEIDLANVDIKVLPFGLAGFLPHPDIPLLYDVKENEVHTDIFMNTKFYSPIPQNLGQRVIRLLPNDLSFKCTSPNDESTPIVLVLKQVCSDIPRCVFVKFSNNVRFSVPTDALNNNLEISNNVNGSTQSMCIIKEEPIEIDECDINYDSNMVEAPASCKNDENYPSCPECGVIQKVPMTEHFLRDNKPFDETLKCSDCRFIASSKCSLSAHIRIHSSLSPFVCPECGKDFDNVNSLFAHLDEVCFHLYKQVRFRCPGKKCGKLFAQTNTYSTHFIMHMECLNKCIICSSAFFNKEDFYQHVKTHEGYNTPVLIYKCNVCGVNNETFTENDYQNHILWHISDRKQCMYVYICRRCRSYFRSKQTYAIHLLRCSKPIPNSVHHFFKRESKEDQIQTKKIIMYYCTSCCSRVNVSSSQHDCPKCGAQLYNYEAKKTMDTAKVAQTNGKNNDKCVLCDETIECNQKELHSKKQCKYINPVILLKPDQVNYEKNDQVDPLRTDVLSQISSVNIDEVDPLELNEVDPLQLTEEDPLKLDDEQPIHLDDIKQEVVSPKSDDSKKKRRKSTNFGKNKKTFLPEVDLDPQADNPVLFDGTYNCSVCGYSTTVRATFHFHVVTHRDISTSYQCMECGECFVVKPSLLKHLTYFHSISDTDEYLKENNCVDRNAVKELEENMKLMPLKFSEPVLENQCRVCRQHFNDVSELKKHTRTHGMAFLLQNSK